MCQINRIKKKFLLLHLFKSQTSHSDPSQTIFGKYFIIFIDTQKQKESYLPADKSIGTSDKTIANGSTYKFSHQVSARELSRIFSRADNDVPFMVTEQILS